MPTPSLAVYFISSTLLANSANTNCRSIQVNFNCSKYSRWTSTTVPHDFVIFFICNIEKPIYCCISAKKSHYNLTKNKFQATVTERCTSPSNSLGIFRHKCFKSTCEKVKSSNRLYYA